MKRTALCLALAFLAAATSAVGDAPPPASFADFDRRAKAGEELSVVFFGGSLTWSANASDPNRTGFRPLVAEHLLAKYPRARFRFHDAGLGGTGSTLGVFRLDRDVLAHAPDLVFLDFACNDGGGPEALAQRCCYESILRRLVGRGIPVVQMFFTFGFWARDLDAPENGHAQLEAYRKLAEAYATGAGDVYRDGPLFPDLRGGRTTLDRVWPFDDAHPGDLGYRYFAAAGIEGFERAVAQGLVCRAPETPVFGDVEDVSRRDLGGAPPAGWSARPAYRASLWFDGLPSRWIDGVAAFSGADRAPFEVRARANLVGVFGEADEKALDCEVRAGDEPLATFRGSHGAGAGRLFIWRQALLSGWERGEAEERAFTFDPIPSPDGTGEFRIGAVCTATIRPATPEPAASSAPAFDLDGIDHGRQP